MHIRHRHRNVYNTTIVMVNNLAVEDSLKIMIGNVKKSERVFVDDDMIQHQEKKEKLN